MKSIKPNLHSLAMKLALVCVLVLPGAVAPSAQQPSSSLLLDAEMLNNVGFHLASYFPTVFEWMKYQDAMKTHQSISVEWNSLPGFSGRVSEETVRGVPLADNFTLLEREQNLPGAAGLTSPLLTEGDLVIAGVSKKGEIRGLRVQHDNRILTSENLLPGTPRGKKVFVTPKVSISVLLPDDPLITKIVFLKPRPNSTQSYELQLVGAMQLPSMARAHPDPKPH
jgi:hypothetical protein